MLQLNISRLILCDQWSNLIQLTGACWILPYSLLLAYSFLSREEVICVDVLHVRLDRLLLETVIFDC